MLRCRVLGHRWRFRAEGRDLIWDCERACGEGGIKSYATPAEARRYAAAFDREDSATSLRRPTISTVPLLLTRRRRGRRGG